MTPHPHPDVDFAPVADPVHEAEPPTTYCTGLAALDSITGGGIRPGDLWLIIGRPGQGRSMLLTQLAGHLALEHHLPTYLVSTRDPTADVSARLHANRTRIPLNHLTENRLTDPDRQRLTRTTQRLHQAPLRVAAGPHARHRAVARLTALAPEQVNVVAIDDPDWDTRWDLHEARALADRGAAVIVTLTHERLLHRAGDHHNLDPAAGLADLVVDVRHDRLDVHDQLVAHHEPGRAAITVLRNRRGPRYGFAVGFFAHYASFFDLDPDGSCDSWPTGERVGDDT